MKFEEIQAKIRTEEQQKLQKLRHEIELEKKAAEQQARAEAEKKVAAMAVERDRTLEKLKQMEAREASIRKAVEDEANLKLKVTLEEVEKRKRLELDAARLALEKDRDQRILKIQAEVNRDREASQKKLKEMERQLQRKTAHEMGRWRGNRCVRCTSRCVSGRPHHAGPQGPARSRHPP